MVLPARSRERPDAAAAPHQELGAGDEHGGREGDDLAPFGGVRRRAAFEVDLARADELEAVFRGYRPEFDSKLLADFAGDLVDDDLAHVERISDRLFRGVEERERRRARAVAQANDPRLVDPLERGGRVRDHERAGALRQRRVCRQKRAYRRDDDRVPSGQAGARDALHRVSLTSWAARNPRASRHRRRRNAAPSARRATCGRGHRRAKGDSH